MGHTSPESHHVKIIVDSGLSWSPLSLRFEDENGFVILPGDEYGRMDEMGWRVFLRAGLEYTATVYLCCVDPGAQVTLEVGGITVILSDPDGDHWYEGTFTAPDPLLGTIRLCVICDQIKRCSDGEILIDPEGVVYDLETGLEVDGAEVTCYEAQSEAGETYYGLWPADEYGQLNPQTTGTDGYYSFFTPAGTYRVGVNKGGYQSHLSGDLVVVDEPVEYNVHLAPEIADAPDYTITVSSLGFDPPFLKVPPGSVIAWINVDGDLHASTSVTPSLSSAEVVGLAAGGAWNSGLLNVGEVYKHQLNSAGTYTYQDGDNGVYTGQILVQNMVYLPIVFREYAP
jgi:plastocyanin